MEQVGRVFAVGAVLGVLFQGHGEYVLQGHHVLHRDHTMHRKREHEHMRGWPTRQSYWIYFWPLGNTEVMYGQYHKQ